MLTKSNATAYCVLSYVYRMCTEDQLATLLIEPYLNGRENGFAISNYLLSKKIVFSENRNSDSVVVYNGRSNDFAFGGNVPSEEVYKYSQHIHDREEAAKFVVASLFY